MTEQGREAAEQLREVLEQAEGAERPAKRPAETADTPVPPSPALPTPEVEGATTHPYVYAIGTVAPRFPTLALEKEFAQSTGRADGTAGLTDREATHSVLSDRANRLPSASVVLRDDCPRLRDLHTAAARSCGLRALGGGRPSRPETHGRRRGGRLARTDCES